MGVGDVGSDDGRQSVVVEQGCSGEMEGAARARSERPEQWRCLDGGRYFHRPCCEEEVVV